MENLFLKKAWIVGIILLFIGASVVSGFNTNSTNSSQPMNRSWLYVGGSGPGNYTSIQSAIDAASNGDTIYVYNGTYNESLVITEKNNLTLIGENKQTTIINAIDSETNMGSIYVVTSYSFRISGFTLRGFNAPCIYFRDLFDSLAYDCILKDSIYGGVIYTEYTSENNTIRDCEIYNNNVGIGVAGANENYYLNRSSILNCSIHNNGIGVSIHGRSDWYGVINHTTINGCSIFNNTDEGIFINQLLGKIQGVTIENNNIRNNSNSGIEIQNASNIDISDCVVYNNSNGVTVSNTINCIIKNITYLFSCGRDTAFV